MINNNHFLLSALKKIFNWNIIQDILNALSLTVGYLYYNISCMIFKYLFSDKK